MKKNIYFVVEALVYVVCPLAIILVSYFFANSFFIALMIGFLMFFSPVIKLYISKKLAKEKEDPRHVFQTSSFWYDGFLFLKILPLQVIRFNGAMSRSLDVIYNYKERFGVKPFGIEDDWWKKLSKFNFLNLLALKWADFWLGMPVAQDVRERANIVASQYTEKILVNKNQKIKILEVAGGHLQPVIMGIKNAISKEIIFEYEVVSIEPDLDFSKPRALELIESFGLEKDCFHFIASRISTDDPRKKIDKILSDNGYCLSSFDIVTCIGLGDYYQTKTRVRKFLNQFSSAKMLIVANISQNYLERYYLHYFIQWPKMKYRSFSEWQNLLSECFSKRKIQIVKTKNAIFNIAIIE